MSFQKNTDRKTSWNRVCGHWILVLPLLVVAFLGMMVPVIHSEEVTEPIVISTSNAESPTLGIPRWKGYMSEIDPNDFWVCYASAGSSANSMNYTTDGGLSWSTNTIQIGETGWLDYHLSVVGLAGDLYCVAPMDYWSGFRKINAPAQSSSDLADLITIPNTTGYHRCSIMVQKNGRIWIFARRNDYPSENVRYNYSDDNGSSWTSGIAYATEASNLRIGSMSYVDDKPALVVLYMGSDRGYEYYLWNGSSFEARPDSSIYAEYMSSVRVFTHNVINDTTFHLIFGLGTSMTHLWKHYNNGSGSWNYQTIENSSTTVDYDWYPISTVHGNDLYLFYCRKSTSDEATSMIYYMKWSQVTESWSAPTIVSTAAGNVYNRDPNTAKSIPVSANYIPVFWWSGSGVHDINFSRIVLSPDTIPPGKIEDLGAVPGQDAGEVELEWTAPGDDGSNGTASYYDIRYTNTTLDENNWSSATSVLNPPIPIAGGETQTFTVSNLTDGQIYHFGIKSYDEADNESVLSNVVTGVATMVEETGDPVYEIGSSLLLNGYPNPFNSSTAIEYLLDRKTHVEISVYDLLGRRVMVLVDSEKDNGQHSVQWAGIDQTGSSVASGVYLCCMKTEESILSQKLLLLK
jgi:hypothetical protein